MRTVDLSRMMQSLAAHLAHRFAVFVGQVQFGLAHSNTPGHQLVIA
ncbi:hypothetical protein [Verminephrobacter aporrectodeae]|nr:hypothetical protein [Verminephrobacter aporrectodeae]